MAVVTLGAGFAGGFVTQARVGSDSGPQPTVAVTVPGPTVTVAGPTVTAAAGAGSRPSVNPLPSAAAGSSPTPTAVRVLTAVPDSGRGGTKAVLAGENYPPDVVVRVAFVVKGPFGSDHARPARHEDGRPGRSLWR